MSDSTYADSRTAFGVGRVIGDTFSIFFRKLPVILLLGFVPSLIQMLIVGGVSEQADMQVSVGAELNFADMTSIVDTLVGLVVGSIVTAAIVQLSYDSKLDNPVRLRVYLATAIRHLPAIVVLSIVSMVLYFIGFALLIVPGLWVYAVFSVFVPAIVIDGAGFRALGRSAELTRNYRWPIVGTLVLMFFCMIGLMLAALAVSGFLWTISGGAGLLVGMMAQAIGTGLVYGLLSVNVALIFARLKEIKEGVSVADLVEVFR